MTWVGKSLRRKEDERLIRGNPYPDPMIVAIDFFGNPYF